MPGSCKGEWLEADALGKIAEHHEEVFTSEEIGKLDGVNKEIFTATETDHDELHCPECEDVEMKHFNYGETSGLLLDKCPKCGGIWLDAGQMEKVEELVDGWKSHLEQDTEAYGEILDKVAAKETEELDQERFDFEIWLCERDPAGVFRVKWLSSRSAKPMIVNDRLLAIAARVIAKADREHPADAVLRTKLKEAKGISREDGRTISEAVFAYYRWLGWLDRKQPIAAQIQAGGGVERRLIRKIRRAFPKREMKQAIPEWATGEVEVSPEWLRALQREPTLWLRARPGKGRELAERLGECWVARRRTAGRSVALRRQGGFVSDAGISRGRI